MREVIKVRQIPGERRRRWFASEEFDLILWHNDDGSFAGFELCYDKSRLERSIVWRPGGGFQHMAIDNGEQRPGKHKASPVLVPDGHFDASRIYSAFAIESRALPPEVASYVLKALEMYPDHGRVRQADIRG